MNTSKVKEQCRTWAEVIEAKRRREATRLLYLDTKDKEVIERRFEEKKREGYHVEPPPMFDIWQAVRETPKAYWVILSVLILTKVWL